MKRIPSLFLAAFIIPLNSPEQWQSLSFNKIKPNTVKFEDSLIKVSVDNSAGPLVHTLPSAIDITHVHVELEVSGEKLPTQNQEKFEEDSVFRLGLVLEGNKTLGFIEKAVAASWVKKLFSLAPKDKGIDKILFLNTAQNKNLLDSERTHPSSELIFETLVWHYNPSIKTQNFQYTFKKPQRTLALWVSIDGDNTQSQFQTVTKRLELNKPL